MTDLKSDALILNLNILEAHKKHFDNSPTGLIKPNESPNSNLIYHLYSDGEITYQKGGWAYKQRSEFTIEPPIGGYNYLDMHFPNFADYGKTFIILTEHECNYFRNKMIELLQKY